MIIYKITNKINGKVYIGQTKLSLDQRWRIHYSKDSGCSALKDAIIEFGKEKFSIEQIDYASNEYEGTEKENYWINFYNSKVPTGYNIKKGSIKLPYSEESKIKMRKNHADFKGCNNPNFNKKLSDETKLKISIANKGRVHSVEAKESMKKNNPKRKIVINLDTGEQFNSSRDAEAYYKFAHGTISRVCRGEGHTAGGFRFIYKDGLNA